MKIKDKKIVKFISYIGGVDPEIGKIMYLKWNKIIKYLSKTLFEKEFDENIIIHRSENNIFEYYNLEEIPSTYQTEMVFPNKELAIKALTDAQSKASRLMNSWIKKWGCLSQK